VVDEGLSLFFARLDYFANGPLRRHLGRYQPAHLSPAVGVWIMWWAVRLDGPLVSTFQSVLLIAIIYRIARDLKSTPP